MTLLVVLASPYRTVAGPQLLRNHSPNLPQLSVQFADVVGRIARPASFISPRLAPAVLRAGKAMMAGKAIKLPVFRPDFAFRSAGEPVHAFFELDCLPNAPCANAE